MRSPSVFYLDCGSVFLFVNVCVFPESCFTMADKIAPSQTLHLSSILIASAEDQELSCPCASFASEARGCKQRLGSGLGRLLTLCHWENSLEQCSYLQTRPQNALHGGNLQTSLRLHHAHQDEPRVRTEATQ